MNTARLFILMLTTSLAVGCTEPGEDNSDSPAGDMASSADDGTNAGQDDMGADEDMATAPDTTPPTVVSTGPASGENVSRANFEVITFETSEQLLPASMIGAYTVTVVNLSGDTIVFDAKHRFAGRWEIYSEEPSWGTGGTYTVEIKGSVTDIAGNAMGSDYTWQFTIGG